MSGININSRKREKKYDKLLNNLLGIEIREQCLFLRVDGISSFDITTKFGEKYSKKILNQKEFDFFFFLNEVDLEQLLKIVQNSNKSSEIIEAYEKYKEQISNTTKLLLENKFLITKRDLICIINDEIGQKKSTLIGLIFLFKN